MGEKCPQLLPNAVKINAIELMDKMIKFDEKIGLESFYLTTNDEINKNLEYLIKIILKLKMGTDITKITMMILNARDGREVIKTIVFNFDRRVIKCF